MKGSSVDVLPWVELLMRSTTRRTHVFGLARNQRLRRIIGRPMHQARTLHRSTGKAVRLFAEFEYQTHKSWSQSRRVVAKAEYLKKGENPRFIVTSLRSQEWNAQSLYEDLYCARGEMENRIKEQMCLFADRLSTDEMKGNQLRLYFSALAYTLLEALRRVALGRGSLRYGILVLDRAVKSPHLSCVRSTVYFAGADGWARATASRFWPAGLRLGRPADRPFAGFPRSDAHYANVPRSPRDPVR